VNGPGLAEKHSRTNGAASIAVPKSGRSPGFQAGFKTFSFKTFSFKTFT
jgi:hypothetical protein